jgi:RNA-directed DNA polymerase
MQALYLLALDPIAETLGAPNAYGFRTERSTADAIEQCCNVRARQHSPQWIVEGDIRACFDGISHNWLWAHIPMETAMLQKWLQAGCMEKHVLYPTATGVPQGGIASPVMANLALDGLEKLLKAHYPPHTTRAQRATVPLVRYWDDCIITGSSYALLEHEVKPLVAQCLGERGLELSPTKTHLTSIEDGFDCLGQHLRT